MTCLPEHTHIAHCVYEYLLICVCVCVCCSISDCVCLFVSAAGISAMYFDLATWVKWWIMAFNGRRIELELNSHCTPWLRPPPTPTPSTPRLGRELCLGRVSQIVTSINSQVIVSCRVHYKWFVCVSGGSSLAVAKTGPGGVCLWVKWCDLVGGCPPSPPSNMLYCILDSCVERLFAHFRLFAVVWFHCIRRVTATPTQLWCTFKYSWGKVKVSHTFTTAAHTHTERVRVWESGSKRQSSHLQRFYQLSINLNFSIYVFGTGRNSDSDCDGDRGGSHVVSAVCQLKQKCRKTKYRSNESWQLCRLPVAMRIATAAVPAAGSCCS